MYSGVQKLLKYIKYKNKTEIFKSKTPVSKMTVALDRQSNVGEKKKRKPNMLFKKLSQAEHKEMK